MIHFIVGTRAQFFKLAPVMLECERRKLRWRWVYTAQHRETIAESLLTFGVHQPDSLYVGRLKQSPVPAWLFGLSG